MKDGGRKTGSTHNSGCIPVRREIPKATPPFSASASSMAFSPTQYMLDICMKLKMAVVKPEVHISQAVF